jgi:hypothetical protein
MMWWILVLSMVSFQQYASKAPLERLIMPVSCACSYTSILWIFFISGMVASFDRPLMFVAANIPFLNSASVVLNKGAYLQNIYWFDQDLSNGSIASQNDDQVFPCLQIQWVCSLLMAIKYTKINRIFKVKLYKVILLTIVIFLIT